MTNLHEITIKPTAKSDIVESEELLDEELFLYDQFSGKVHTLNSGAAMIWYLCDGTLNLEQIAGQIASAGDMSGEQVLPQVQQTIDDFKKLGLLE